MKLFRHYKNKDYKYFGTAKHSETLEDMVVYKPLYTNSESELWVRPKEMFFENVSLNGESLPRFKGILPKIKNYEFLTDETLKILASLFIQVNQSWSWDEVSSSLHSKPDRLIQIAYFEDEAVGFKIGYKISNTIFYSWYCGVAPNYRNLGVARALIAEQHGWCFKSGFETIQTEIENTNKHMLILNLSSGFKIIDLLPQTSADTIRLLLQKTLSES